MIWHLYITPRSGCTDLLGRKAAHEAELAGLGAGWSIAAGRGFLVETSTDRATLEPLARSAFLDPVVETLEVRPAQAPWNGPGAIVHVLPKPGVTDPEGESAAELLHEMGLPAARVRSIRTHRIEGPPALLPRLIDLVLHNDAVEQAIEGAIPFAGLGDGQAYSFRKVLVPIRGLDDASLLGISREGGLSLTLDEMRTIARHFVERGREPSDVELETLAQTWSEHCSHKTLKGRIAFEGAVIDDLLRTTIFKATQELSLDWLVSVFRDNAGVIRFDDGFDVCFKVETHNHPSAIDPYGGSNTGLGGVLRDILGTGLGARPICDTDVFCTGPFEIAFESLPRGVLHPKRVLKGVVAGVRDYGNRMGVPTVNGAVAVDPGYLANPLVFCGSVGLLPRGAAEKRVEPGDLIVALGGRTGRDGIHGATFSSAELTSESDALSGGAVQIGHAIAEKKLLDVVLQARDRGLFHAITDCGAGGFSSAVGEMGADLGAEVHLERAPLKYQGLSYTEIWISEAQERMVLAVPPAAWPELKELCAREDVEAACLGTFEPTGWLRLYFEGHLVGELEMDFLHDGRPRVVRQARHSAREETPYPEPARADFTADLHAILAHGDVCSKEWIIRQYDHEVQGRTVVKPLVGVRADGPGDAAVVTPVRGSTRGLAVACGLNPRYGRLDPYAMAACVIDEAIRNCVAVGADPSQIALLDNFCWGDVDDPDALGAIVLAARACHDLSLEFRAPFISGKDSLNNVYAHEGKRLSIPHTLLISAMGIVPDVRQCVTMDLKSPGNTLAIIGLSRNELGGSIHAAAYGLEGGRVPRVEPQSACATFQKLHKAIRQQLVQSCHDLSEGGLAAAVAEMAMAGGLGASIELERVPRAADVNSSFRVLFSESPSRFLIECRPVDLPRIGEILGRCVFAPIGVVAPPHSRDEGPRLTITGLDRRTVVDAPLDELAYSWKRTLDWR